MEDYSREMHRKHHYSFVQTPHITKGGLYETSGHLHWYKDGMYPPMHLDEEYDADGNITKPGADYYLKPMNCPMHNLIFKSRQRSTASCRCVCSSSAPCTVTRSPARCTA